MTQLVIDELLTSLGESPRIVERLLRVFPSARLDDRISGSNFSPREVVAMLADSEMVVLDRFRMGANKPGSEAPWYDAAERAKEAHFSEKDVFREAEVFDSRRQMTLDFLRALPAEDFEKTFHLTGAGAFTLREYVNVVMGHDLRHIALLSQFLATEVATIS